MEKVKLGIIGAGGIAQVHCRVLTEMDGVELVAVSDIVEANARRTAGRWGIPNVYTDYEEMLQKEELDGVVVCTPTARHAQPTIAALKSGRHVLCEKPMDASLEAATEMVRTAHEMDKILMVAIKFCYSPQLIVARRIVEEGTLGDIYYAECVLDRRRGNPGRSFIYKDTAGLGVAADLGVYALYDALFVMGFPKPVAVAGITSNYISRHSEPVISQWAPNLQDTEVEDFAAAWVRFENGTRLVFKTSWCMHMDTLGGNFFLGTKAGLRLKQDTGELVVYRDEFGALTDVIVHDLPKVEGIELFRREDAAFVEAVREGKPSPIDPDEMLLTDVIIQGVIDSNAAGGREVEVSVPTF